MSDTKPLRFAMRRDIQRAISAQHHTIAKMEKALDKKYEELRQLEALLQPHEDYVNAHDQSAHEEPEAEPASQEQGAGFAGLSAEEGNGPLSQGGSAQEAQQR